MTSAALAQRLSREKDVEYAVPDRRKPRRAAPNDPLYTTAGTPGTSSGGPAAGQWYLRAPTSAHAALGDQRRGGLGRDDRAARSVVVAVLDTGVRFDHPDLGGQAARRLRLRRRRPQRQRRDDRPTRS